jgi:hypothetical protein
MNDEFDNVWLCPYCTAPTEPADRTCPICRKPLIVSKRVQPERSAWLWRGIILQFVVAAYLVAFGASYLTVMAKLKGVSNPLLFIPLYMGLPVEQPPQLIETVLGVFPMIAFWGIIAAALFSLAMMILLYFRAPYTNVLYLVSAGVTLLLGFLGIAFFHALTGALIGSVLAVLLGLAQLLITLNLWEDFTFNEHRLQLKVSSGIKNHVTLYLTARNYARQGMWGSAILHLRRAIAREPNKLPYHLALTVAYLNIKRYDLAAAALQQAERLDPGDADVQRLRHRMSNIDHTLL